MSYTPNINREKGFTILEIIAAVFILIVAVVAICFAFSQIVVATSLVSSRLTAAYLAQEGIEIIRNIRDSNWFTLGWDVNLSTCSSGCEADYTTGTGVLDATPLRNYTGNHLNIDEDNFYSYLAGTPTRFTRKITVTADSDYILRVSVLVNWQDRGKSYNYETEESLYDWY